MIEQLQGDKFKDFKEFDNHESVISFFDEDAGLRGFIAIHSKALGPATGGTRYWHYGGEEEAIKDVLNLSRAMTYKCALARVPFGGGKAVIMANDRVDRSELMRAFARVVNSLDGQFSTGEDVGIGDADIEAMAEVSPHINGLPESSGDSSSMAALGVLYAIKAALGSIFGSEDLAGRKVAVKGLGKVGMELCGLLYREGCGLSVADIDDSRLMSARERFPKVNLFSSAEIHKLNVDIYSPCAMGGDFTERTIGELGCRIICGAANNQLAETSLGASLHGKNIYYIPDYIANAGGLIDVVDVLCNGSYDSGRVKKKVLGIKNTVSQILNLSRRADRSTSEIADKLARRIIYGNVR